MVEHFGDIARAEQLLQLLALALHVQPLQHHAHVHALQDDDGSCVQFMTNYVKNAMIILLLESPCSFVCLSIGHRVLLHLIFASAS